MIITKTNTVANTKFCIKRKTVYCTMMQIFFKIPRVVTQKIQNIIMDYNLGPQCGMTEVNIIINRKLAKL